MSQVQLLYRLQLLDSELDEAGAELARIAAVLGESQALKQAQKAVETADKALRQTQARMLDLDLEVKSLADKISQQDKILYSGKVSSAKEAANLQDEVAALKRWREKREELLLEAMVEADEGEDRLARAQAELATIQAQWTAGQEELSHKQSALQARVADLRAQRPLLIGTIEADNLSEYEELRTRKAGRAVAALQNGVCQGCGIAASNSKIQRTRAAVELTYCSTCGRILYVP